MSQPTRSRPRWAYGATRPSALLGLGLALGFAQCTFPHYETSLGALAGSGARAGNAASAGTGGNGATSQGAAGEAMVSEAGASNGGALGCPGEQWPVNRCEGGCLTRYPDHCYDGQSNDQEVAVDCGGECQLCTNEVCATGADCLSGACDTGDQGMQCHSPLRLTFTAHELNEAVGSTAWDIKLLNAEPTNGSDFTLKDLELRYYFDRNGATEPIVVRATQSNMQLESGENLGLKSTSWLVEHTEDSDEAAYNAYVSVTFGDPGRMFPGDTISLYQQMLSGDPSNAPFDQRANYSHTKVQGGEWLYVNVFYQGQLVWGLEPRASNPRTCFVKGVNFNGTAAVTVDGHVFLSASDAKVTTTGTGISQGNTLFPVAGAELTALLSSATRLQVDQTLTFPVDNGLYLAYLYAVSATNDGVSSVLTVQGVSPSNSGKFRSQAVDSGYAWTRLGPYRVDVSDGTFRVGVTSGAVHFAAAELWYPE